MGVSVGGDEGSGKVGRDRKGNDGDGDGATHFSTPLGPSCVSFAESGVKPLMSTKKRTLREELPLSSWIPSCASMQ